MKVPFLQEGEVSVLKIVQEEYHSTIDAHWKQTLVYKLRRGSYSDAWAHQYFRLLLRRRTQWFVTIHDMYGEFICEICENQRENQIDRDVWGFYMKLSVDDMFDRWQHGSKIRIHEGGGNRSKSGIQRHGMRWNLGWIPYETYQLIRNNGRQTR